MPWGRIIFVVVGLAALIGILWVGLTIRASMHKTYIAEGSIEISPPGPPGVTAPAAVCMWANGFQMATPEAAREPRGSDAYVLCTLDTHASAPFEVSRYSNTGRGLLIGAFLMSIPGGHPACEGQSGLVTVEAEQTSQLDSLCRTEDMPPRSEIALMAPFDDDEGRPTTTMRIAITKAE
jgi:hypothetical protein